MRLIIVLGAICTLTGAASAQTADCSAIADPTAKLACYNNEAPPAPARSATARHPATARPPAVARPTASSSDSSKYVDRIGEEDAIVSAKMRGICRGC